MRGERRLGTAPRVLATGHGWAALSTSAVALGRLSDLCLDRNALGVAALAGHALGPYTVVSDVRRLQGGEVCELRGGVAEVTRVAPPGIAPESWTADEDAIRRTGADAVRQIVGEALERAVEPVLELSGGLDSRVLLAAVPPELRRGLSAITIGAPDSGDVLVASEIARRSGARPHVHRHPGRGGAVSRPGAASSPFPAGRRVDWSGNPVTLGMLWVESRIADDRPRIGPERRVRARFLLRASPSLAAQRRRDRDGARAVAGDRQRPGRLRLLRPDHRSRARGGAPGAAWSRVPRPFLAATDELYLEMPMGRWVGPAYTLSSRSMTVLAPFFDHRSPGCGRRAEPRRGSCALAGVLQRLDGDLASIPLADGPPPNILAGGGLRATRATAPAFAGKVAERFSGSAPSRVHRVTLARRRWPRWFNEPGQSERTRSRPGRLLAARQARGRRGDRAGQAAPRAPRPSGSSSRSTTSSQRASGRSADQGHAWSRRIASA